MDSDFLIKITTKHRKVLAEGYAPTPTVGNDILHFDTVSLLVTRSGEACKFLIFYRGTEVVAGAINQAAHVAKGEFIEFNATLHMPSQTSDVVDMMRKVTHDPFLGV